MKSNSLPTFQMTLETGISTQQRRTSSECLNPTVLKLLFIILEMQPTSQPGTDGQIVTGT